MNATINVQFADSTDQKIVAYFAGPQDPSVYTNLGTVEANDARWAAFYAATSASAPGLPSPTQS